MLIESDTQLAGIAPAQDKGGFSPSISVRRAKLIPEIDLEIWQLQRRITVDPKGQYWSLYQGNNSYLLEYEGILQFIIASDGKEVTYAGRSDVPEESFQWNLVHLVLPLSFHLRNIPVYHAGAANTQLGSVLFFGHSGQGKSTLTAAFGQAGCPIVTDDILVLQEHDGKFYSVPGLPWVRLCQESFDVLFGADTAALVIEDGDGKMRVDASAGLLPFATEPATVSGVYVLTNSESNYDDQLVTIKPISSAQAVGILLGRDIMLPILAKDQVASVFAFLGKLTVQVPVWEITISRDLNRLPEVVSEILKHEQHRRVLSSVPAQENRQ